MPSLEKPKSRATCPWHSSLANGATFLKGAHARLSLAQAFIREVVFNR
jgi:hypothetical protein